MEEEEQSLIGSNSTSDEECGENTAKIVSCGQRVALLALLLLQFCHLTTDSLLIPFFPDEAFSKGLTHVHLGIVYSAYELTRCLSAPIFGTLILTIGPKRMCVIGSVISSSSCVGFGLVSYITHPTAFFALCVGIRLAAGCAAVMISISVTCILLKSSVFNSSTVIGLIELVLGAAYGIGAGIGAALYHVGGYRTTFWVVGGVSAMFALVVCFVPNIEQKNKEERGFMQMICIPGVFLLFVNIVVLKIGRVGIGSVITPFITQQFDVPPTTVAIGWAIWPLGYMATCPLISHITKKGFVWSQMTLVWIIMMLIYILMAPSPLLDFIFHGYRNLWIPMILMFWSYVYQAGIMIPNFRAALDIVSVNGYDGENLKTYGMVTGMTNAAIGLGATLGPVSAGVLVQTITFDWYSTAVTLSYLAMLLVNIIFLSYMRICKKPLKPPSIAGYRCCAETLNNIS